MPIEGVKAAEDVFKIFFRIIAGVVAVVFLVALYGLLVENDSLAGFPSFPHTKTVDLYMTDDWPLGETLDCFMETTRSAGSKPTGKILGIACPFGNKEAQLHQMKVTFYGDLSPTDSGGKPRSLPEQWLCTRQKDGFTCKIAGT